MKELRWISNSIYFFIFLHMSVLGQVDTFPHDGSCIEPENLKSQLEQGNLLPIEETYIPVGNNSTVNNRWKQINVNVCDPTGKSIAMVLVPPGEFEMGSNEEDIENAMAMCETTIGIPNECRIDVGWFYDEYPTRKEKFDNAYLIDKYEVSRSSYSNCVQDQGGCDPIDESDAPLSFPSGTEYPVNRATWENAYNYCSWKGSSLPTEAQWEYAARGPDRRIFPWGDEFHPRVLEANHCDENFINWFGDNANEAQPYCDYSHNDGYAFIAPIDSFPNGQSWVGAYNMAGNVTEWTMNLSSDYRNSPRFVTKEEVSNFNPEIVVRGGSWFQASHNVRSAHRHLYKSTYSLPPTGLNDDRLGYAEIGFRCVIAIGQ